MSNGPTNPTCCRLPSGPPCVPNETPARVDCADGEISGEHPDWSDRFIDEIKHDVRAGRIRRAHVHNPPQIGADATAEIHRRLSLLITTGKRDYLIDVSRLAMEAWIYTGEPQEIPRGAFN